MKWISVEDRLPQITRDELVSGELYYQDENGVVKAGYIHSNGCFYSYDKTHVASTEKARRKYGREIEHMPHATHWTNLPEPPED